MKTVLRKAAIAAIITVAGLCLGPASSQAQSGRHHTRTRVTSPDIGETTTPARYYSRTSRAGFVWLGAIIPPMETTWEYQVAAQNDRLPRLNLKRNPPVMNTWEQMNWSPNNDVSGRWPREAYWW